MAISGLLKLQTMETQRLLAYQEKTMQVTNVILEDYLEIICRAFHHPLIQISKMNHHFG